MMQPPASAGTKMCIRDSPSTGKLVGFAAVLGLLLVAMGTYRSPAVALMPDVTPNPLRSRANAIINQMCIRDSSWSVLFSF